MSMNTNWNIFVLVKDKKIKYAVNSEWTLYQLKEFLETQLSIKFDIQTYSFNFGYCIYRLRSDEYKDELFNGLYDTIVYDTEYSLTDCKIHNGDCLHIFKEITFPFQIRTRNWEMEEEDREDIKINLYWTLGVLKTQLQWVNDIKSFTLNINEQDEEYLEDFLNKYEVIEMYPAPNTLHPIFSCNLFANLVE